MMGLSHSHETTMLLRLSMSLTVRVSSIIVLQTTRAPTTDDVFNHCRNIFKLPAVTWNDVVFNAVRPVHGSRDRHGGSQD